MGGMVTTFSPNMLAQQKAMRQIRNPMRPNQRRDILEGHCYIFNITSQSWGPIYRTHGVYLVFGKDSEDRVAPELLNDRFGFDAIGGIGFSWAKINGRVELVENGIEAGRGVSYDEVATEHDLIAQDVVDWCNQCRPATETAVEPSSGIFWEANRTPDHANLKEAQRRLFAYYRALVEEGDKIWAEKDTNTGVKVESLMKTAFRTLKAAGKLSGDKPWVFDPAPPPETQSCKACKLPIPKDALRCSHCQAFQSSDVKLLRTFYPTEFSEEVKPERPAHK